MTKIIQFPQNNKVNTTKPTYDIKFDTQPQVKFEQPCDTFEFQDYALDEVDVKSQKSLTPKTPKSQLVAKAWDYYDKALKTRDKVSKLIKKAEANGFADMLDSKGNLITFEEDILGRTVMIECDENAIDKRKTTFTPYQDKIWKINTFPHTQIVFFDYGKDYTEITKTTKPNILGNYTSEVYCYENGRPVSYFKHKQNLFSDKVTTETCEF